MVEQEVEDLVEVRRYTFEEMAVIYADRFNELLVYAGNNVHLGLMLDVSTQVVIGWTNRKRISKEGAKLVGNHPTLGKKFKAVYLRPDLALVDDSEYDQDWM